MWLSSDRTVNWFLEQRWSNMASALCKLQQLTTLGHCFLETPHHPIHFEVHKLFYLQYLYIILYIIHLSLFITNLQDFSYAKYWEKSSFTHGSTIAWTRFVGYKRFQLVWCFPSKIRPTWNPWDSHKGEFSGFVWFLFYQMK